MKMKAKTTFINPSSDSPEKKLRETGLKSLLSRKCDFEEYMNNPDLFEEGSDELGPFHEYGLSFDNMLETDGYYRFQLSTGGPGTEVRFYGSEGKIEFVYLNWFCGVGFDVSEDEVFQWLREMFEPFFVLE